MAADCDAEKPRTGALELLEAVTPEDVHFAGGDEIRAHIEAIGIEGVVTRAEKVIARHRGGRSVRQGDQSQKSLGLRRQAICWYHIACELSSVRGCDVASCRKARYFVRAGIVDVLAQNAEVGSGAGADTSSFEGGGYAV